MGAGEFRFTEGAARGIYPSADQISYIADVGGYRSYFPTDDAYSHSWFYPRYAGGRLHEPVASRFLLDSLTSTSVFVDVGAHLGYFSVIAAQKARRVFAIEAQEALIGRIHRNVAANHLGNVQTILAAAGNRPGFAAIPKAGSASTSVAATGWAAGQEAAPDSNLVPMLRLDDYFTGPLTPTHVKIDTEGFEYQVLEGMSEILKSRPVLLIELHIGMSSFGFTITDLVTQLRRNGYELTPLHHRANPQDNVHFDVEAMARVGNFMVLCRPAE